MIGAVVGAEWRLRSRRDQFRPFLSCYFFCVLLDCCVLYYGLLADIFLPPSPTRSGQLLACAVDLLWLQLWLLPLLLAPPLVANALAAEKANGMLTLLFATPVNRSEIILGKFLGRVFPLALLGLAHLPFWGLFAGLIGFNPLSACILAGVALLPILAAGAASLLAAVWCRKTADAVVGLYALFTIGILGIWAVDPAGGSGWLAILENLLQSLGPYYLLGPLREGCDGLLEVGSRALIATAAWGSLAAGCLALACWRLNPRSTDRPEIRRPRLPSRQPSVGDDPISWKERYRERRMPLALFRNIPNWLALLGVFVGTASLILWCLCPDFTQLVEYLTTADLQTLNGQLGASAPRRPALALLLMLAMLLLGALTVGVRCATAISSERESRTWELLLLTPLSTHELVHGKVRGILQSARPYIAAYALAAVPLAWLAGPAELLVTVLAILMSRPTLSVAAAIGIDQSARSASSWQGVLGTVKLLIGATLLTAFVSNFVLCFVALILLALPMQSGYLRLVIFIVVLGSFWTLLCRQGSREYLAKAEEWIDKTERMRGAALSEIVHFMTSTESTSPAQP